MSAGENKIETVEANSPAGKAGLLPGDFIISINKHKINDGLDLAFYSQGSELSISIKSKGKTERRLISKEKYENLGVELKPLKIKTCNNRCFFCFVYQLPKGLRKSLYIKDEDYRLSFLYGNYITLSTLSNEEKKRIVSQKLSPLYISVHSTNNSIRQKMLCNNNIPDIIDDIRFFTRNKIKLHTQIVLCPGYNDAKDLENTIKDLYKFYPYVASIAVVPVGLTRYQKRKINPVKKEDAENALLIIDRMKNRFFKKHGEAIVYASDELYIKLGKRFPSLKFYGDFPQLENGVGMIPLFLHKAKSLKKLSVIRRTPVITFTGKSFYPFLAETVLRLNNEYGTKIKVLPIENRFFGESITVTGLLTGRDIINTLFDNVKGNEVLLIPDVVLKDGDNILIDDISTDFISETLGIKTKIIQSSFTGLINSLKETD